VIDKIRMKAPYVKVQRMSDTNQDLFSDGVVAECVSTDNRGTWTISLQPRYVAYLRSLGLRAPAHHRPRSSDTTTVLPFGAAAGRSCPLRHGL
jgi:hypothetical protein